VWRFIAGFKSQNLSPTQLYPQAQVKVGTLEIWTEVLLFFGILIL
jgi:hypothetical protein